MKARILIAAAVLAVGAPQLYAATIAVTSTNDSGPGTLRDALASAADGDTIDASSITGTILLTNGELLVTNSVNIIGPGPDLLAINGNQRSRVFHIGSRYSGPPHTVVISGLTITNGAGPGEGGGIYNRATLSVSNCIVSGNSTGLGEGDGGGGICNNNASLRIVASTISRNSTRYFGGGISNIGEPGLAILQIVDSTIDENSTDFGGGIYNRATFGSVTLQVVDCSVSGNLVSGGGGGILNDCLDGGIVTVQVVDSTLSSNSVRSYVGGGGILNWVRGGSGILRIVNSTFSGNWAGNNGGAINNSGLSYTGTASVEIVSSTFSDNSANNGGSIYNLDFATLDIGNTILNGGISGATITNDSGTITSLGYNLSSDDGGGYLTGPGDIINTDPMLGPLQDNGGPTFTCALLPGSPAINAGDPNFTPPPDFDQRGPGFPRVACGRIDIGAFEVQTLPDSDGDGVPDMFDQCPNTLPGAIVDTAGCSIAQLAPCAGPATGGTWKSHGQYVAAVVHEATVFLQAGLITRRQWMQIVTQAARSRCGWNRRWDRDGDRDWNRSWDCDRDFDWGRDRN
jgi:hypothetical protein